MGGASSDVGQASRWSPSENPPHLLAAAALATKQRLKAIIQSHRQARRLSYGMVKRTNLPGCGGGAAISRNARRVGTGTRSRVGCAKGSWKMVWQGGLPVSFKFSAQIF
jgi:hypothetical protein